MKLMPTLFGLLLTFSLAACSARKIDVENYKQKFIENKKDFEVLVELLKTQRLRGGHSVRTDELSKEVKQCLDKLDILNVTVNFTKCNGVVEYQFTTSWSSNATVYLSKNICDNRQSENGFFRSSEMVDVYGMGDDWILWIDHDFI